MSKRSPLQIVQEDHGSKPELAKKVFKGLDQPEDEDEAHDLEFRIQKMSNRKLLRLWNAQQVLEEKFGSKQELIDAIESAEFPGGNDDYVEKLQGYNLPKLLDVARQNNLLKASELSWR